MYTQKFLNKVRLFLAIVRYHSHGKIVTLPTVTMPTVPIFIVYH